MRRSERVLPFVAVFVVALAAIGLFLAREHRRARRIVSNEDEAVAVLQRLRAAQVVYRAQAGRYGWLGELEAAGLLEGLELHESPAPPHVRLTGYRIDVLLPYGRVGGENLGLVGERDPRAADPRLSEAHFALVARPLEPGRSGWRMFYLDEDDRLFLNEGVVDTDSAMRNELPAAQVKRSQPQQSSRPYLWQRADEIDRD